jgi:hypothetical protein
MNKYVFSTVTFEKLFEGTQEECDKFIEDYGDGSELLDVGAEFKLK